MQREKVLAVLRELPEEVDVDALTERLYLLQKIDEAEKEIAAGKGIPHEEARRRLAKWLTQRWHREPSPTWRICWNTLLVTNARRRDDSARKS